MRKLFSFLLVGILLMTVLSACGQKSQKEIVAALDKKLNNLTGYKANAVMEIKAEGQLQTYRVEIWHKKKDYYRIHVQNAKNDQSQMILRNDKGVYVLTPQLNKSYRFQSKWPKDRSQWYLYESLVSDILNDADATFKATDDAYVFETNTNYQHKNLQRQEINLSKDELKPKSVKIMNAKAEVVVNVKFEKVKFNPKFEKNAFDLEHNKTSLALEAMPAMAPTDSQPFTVFYPANLPAGTELVSNKTLEGENGKKVVLQYTGKKSFTLIEQKAKVSESGQTVMAMGEPVNLGNTFGRMTDDAISWTNDGMKFFLASKDLSSQELQALASSIYEQAAK